MFLFVIYVAILVCCPLSSCDDVIVESSVTDTSVEELMTSMKRLERLQKTQAEENKRLQSRLELLENTCQHEKLHKTLVARSDDISPLEVQVSMLSQRVDQLTASTSSLSQQIEQLTEAAQVAVYTRWGHDACPADNELVYTGFVGGSHSSNSGSAANYLCLPTHPQYDRDEILDNLAMLFGGEYHTNGEASYLLDALCTVCRAPRASTVVIPAANQCMAGWTLEYNGHLMAGRPDHAAASEFICVDREVRSRAGSGAATDGKLLYYTKTVCGTLPCPPYQNNKIVPCVVCSK